MKQLEAHPNILQLIGCITSSDPVCLVMEHAVNGDLLSYLQSQRTTQIPVSIWKRYGMNTYNGNNH